MKKKHKIRLIDAEPRTVIIAALVFDRRCNKLLQTMSDVGFTKSIPHSFEEFKNLYVTSTDKVTMGDYFIHDNKVHKCLYVLGEDEENQSIYCEKEREHFSFDCERVVATTNTKLWWMYVTEMQGIPAGKMRVMPGIDLNWIKEIYIPTFNANSQIKEVMVQYVEDKENIIEIYEHLSAIDYEYGYKLLLNDGFVTPTLVMKYNVCSTCGAKDGRAGMLIDTKDGNGAECLNCYDTRKSGEITLHGNLSRTEDEIKKTFKILDSGN